MKVDPKSLNRRQFLRVAGASDTLSLSLISSHRAWSATAAAVPQTRLNRLAKGANICRWFRGFGRGGQDRFANYITESEAKLMRQMGLTHLRFCLQPKVVMDHSPGAIL